jgi:hypothetical protein
LSGYQSSEAAVEAARQRASGLNKRATLMTCLLKKRRAVKAALCFTEKGQKAACQRKSTMDKKERIAYSRLQVLMKKGGMKSVTIMMMKKKPVMPITSPCDSISGY